MTGTTDDSRSTGLLGPVALSGAALLLVASPLMRGGNRHVALIALEWIALLVLAATWARFLLGSRNHSRAPRRRWILLLAASPALLALIQLTPIPADWWAALPGRAPYVEALKSIGEVITGWRPLSISPDATLDSLLAGIPVAVAFLVGYLASIEQLRLLLRVVVGLAFAEVLMGLLQVAGGIHSPLFFGMLSYGPPIGTFANRNHYANYLAMALVALVWLAYENNRDAKINPRTGSFGARHRSALWAAGGLLLVLGILMSRSRGAGLFGLPAAAFALAVVSFRINGWSRGWRFALPVVLLVLLSAAALIGFEAATTRISAEQLASSAGFRGTLARTSMDAALAYWPWGAGWGTYDVGYPRFQPLTIAGQVNHAHMDYVEMLYEGGMFFMVLAAVFTWLAARRAWRLARTAFQQRTLDREAMAAALCGIGLLGFLLHSLVEFNMRIPANAILAALLAGATLRPLKQSRLHHDRPSQPHTSWY